MVADSGRGNGELPLADERLKRAGDKSASYPVRHLASSPIPGNQHITFILLNCLTNSINGVLYIH
jgi:hypothetical protein